MRHSVPSVGRRMSRRTKSTKRIAHWRCMIVLGSVLAACTDGTPAAVRAVQPSSAALRAVVTGPAAAAVAVDGRFQLAAAPQSQGEISSTTANEIASAWLRSHASMIRDFIEKTHGGSVNFSKLSPCGRTLYAQSPFQPLPSDVPAPYRRPFGSWWLVTYCDDGQRPTVSVAVSALATELRIANGKLTFPSVSGNEIFALGIPSGHQGEYPISPEAAVQIAADQTGVRVAKVPELVIPLTSDGPPQTARWRIALERSASFARSSDVVSSSEVFLGVSPAASPRTARTQPLHLSRTSIFLGSRRQTRVNL